MSIDNDIVATNYKVYPTGWFDACNEVGLLQDSFSVHVTRGYLGRWFITRGVTHWSKTHNEWRETHNGYSGKPPLLEDYMDLDTALTVARELVDNATNVRRRTFAQVVEHERSLRAEQTAKVLARRKARAQSKTK